MFHKNALTGKVIFKLAVFCLGLVLIGCGRFSMGRLGKDAGMLNPPSTPTWTPTAADHFISPKAGSGEGMLSNPYGLADLTVYHTDADQNFTYYAPGPAITKLQPGDTLYFLAGTYSIQGIPRSFGNAFAYGQVILGPTTSGTADKPITIRNYPGAAVIINQTSDTAQPIFGGSASYIRYLGFTIHQSQGDSTQSISQAFRLENSSYNEIAYNTIIGHTWLNDNGDNYEAIQLISYAQTCIGNWIHHNDIGGIKNTSNSPNAVGIKMYNNGWATIEDNYIHDCTGGIYDKASGITASQPPGFHDITYRRNYFRANGYDLTGPGQLFSQQSVLHIYDNVFTEGNLNLGHLQTGSQVYNNLILGNLQGFGFDYLHGGWVTMGGGDNLSTPIACSMVDTQFWNNIVFASGPFNVIHSMSSDFVPLNAPGAPVSYMDYNVYTGAPSYLFGTTSASGVSTLLTSFSLPQFQAQGGETHTSVVTSPLSIYNDQTNYVLRSTYQTAGRYGDAVGPRVRIGGTGGILDISRYGAPAK